MEAGHQRIQRIGISIGTATMTELLHLWQAICLGTQIHHRGNYLTTTGVLIYLENYDFTFFRMRLQLFRVNC